MEIQLLSNYCVTPGRLIASQNYFLMGFHEIPEITITVEPGFGRLFYKLYQKKVKGALRSWNLCNSLVYRNCYRQADRAGRYIFNIQGRPVKVVVDVWDDREILDQDALAWSDIFFKVNMWPAETYPAKVHPLVNGNGRLNPQKLALLNALRGSAKVYDLNFMSVVWFWPNDNRMHNLIEHHVRTFEALSRVDCRKKLLAVIPSYWPKHSQRELKNCLARLDRAGVPWQYTWEGVSSEALFKSLAASRIVFLRPGNALCISWRMIDLLCLGACIAYDGLPFPNWPVPLKAGEHFYDCDCRITGDYSIPPLEQYRNINAVIENLLASPQKIETISANNRAYFDNHATPQKVAAYILDTVQKEVG